jgi:hypothetical protein
MSNMTDAGDTRNPELVPASRRAGVPLAILVEPSPGARAVRLAGFAALAIVAMDKVGAAGLSGDSFPSARLTDQIHAIRTAGIAITRDVRPAAAGRWRAFYTLPASLKITLTTGEVA